MVLLEFIDAHCHLVEPHFDNTILPEIIKHAQDNQVIHIINCASFPDTFSQCIESSEYRSVDVTIGMQPSLADPQISVEPLIQVISDYPKTIKAIGEVGLDYHWHKEESHHLLQQKLFRSCIDIANNAQLPLVIHSRKAESECLDMLEKHAEVDVLLHSFEGNLKEVKRAIDLGYLITIPTNVTIRKNRRKVAIRAGLDNIMIETDSPFCPPDPDMQPNTPASIPIAARKLASLYDTDIAEVARITTRNVRKFHNI